MKKRMPHHRNRSNGLRGVALALLMSTALAVFAQAPEPDAEAPDGFDLKFVESPISMVLAQYAEVTGRTLLVDPKVNLNATVTLRSRSRLEKDEFLEAIRTILAMNQIGLQEKDDKFLRVIPTAAFAQYPIKVGFEDASELPDTEGLVSQMVVLRHIEIAEAQKAFDHLKSPFAQIQAFERMNSVLITDSASNIKEIIKVVEYIDKPAISREELIIVQIQYSKASEIKTKLEEIITQAQTDEQKRQQTATAGRPAQTGAPGITRTTPGVIRPPRAVAVPNVAGSETVEDAEPGLIQGSVKIVADDRTGILIFITRPENMEFFKRIVSALDVETQPDVIVKVVRLEFAKAETIASMLNDLIGSPNEDETSAVPTTGEGGTAESGELSAFLRQRQAAIDAQREKLKSSVGELSADNIKILPDERTNALMLMGSKADLATLEEIIGEMDMMLAQVLIEVVILEITLSDGLQTGFDWLQKAYVVSDTGSDGNLRPTFGFGGKAGGGGNQLATADGLMSSPVVGGVAGASYFVTGFDLDVDLLLSLSAQDSRARVVSSPVILTTDNTPASARIDRQIYVRTGAIVSGVSDSVTTQTETRNVGLSLEVTPHINKNNFVMLEIKQENSDIGEVQVIDGNEFPQTATRSFEASITVRDRETVVLGGLSREAKRESEGGVPLLKDIPLLGMLFGSRSKSSESTELLVLITPYVSDTPEAAETEAARRVDAVDPGSAWTRGWTDSKLAEPTKAEKKEEKRREKEDARARRDAEKQGAVVPPSQNLHDADSSMGTVAPETNAALLQQILQTLEQMKSMQAATEAGGAAVPDAGTPERGGSDAALKAQIEALQTHIQAIAAQEGTGTPEGLDAETREHIERLENRNERAMDRIDERVQE